MQYALVLIAVLVALAAAVPVSAPGTGPHGKPVPTAVAVPHSTISPPPKVGGDVFPPTGPSH